MAGDTTELDSRAFGLACGLLWSLAVVGLGLMARVGWGKRWEGMLADVYRGYNETVTGLVLGAVWGFFDGFTGGFALAWLYDQLRSRPAPWETAPMEAVPERESPTAVSD